MSNLVPKTLVDKNGHTTTRMVRAEDGGNVSADRVAGASKPVAGSRIYNLDYVFDSTTSDYSDKDIFDVRDVQRELNGYADDLESYVADLGDEEASTAEFDPENDDSDELKSELAMWNGLANGLGIVHVTEPPESENIHEWAQYARDLGADWANIGDNAGVTMISENGLEDFAENFARDSGDIGRDTPAYLENNIDWEAVGKHLVQGLPSVRFNGTDFYLS